MLIGVPKEIKNRENRVGMTPAGVRAYVAHGHQVKVQKGAGLGSGISNESFQNAGAILVEGAKEIWDSEMVVKVKEPLPEEYEFFQKNQIIFTYLHLAAEKKLTQVLLEKQITGIAYETIQEVDGSLPLLRPMSEVAGRMSIQIGAYYLQSSWDSSKTGKGVLLGGVPGVAPGTVTIIGGGVAGTNAVQMALGLGAQVIVLDIDPKRLEYLDHVFKGRLTTLMSNHENIEQSVVSSDLLVGAVLIPGAKAPKLVSRKVISKMKPGSVVVDIAVDQGGCIETCKPTSHENPVFVEEGVTHYCVTNMPGAVARTSTYALNNVTLKYGLMIANLGAEKAAQQSKAVFLGFNTYHGKLVYSQVAEAWNIPYSPLAL